MSNDKNKGEAAILQDEEAARKKGIEAIIFLQGLVGITETREKAEAGWNGMQAWERTSTLQAYAVIKPKECGAW